MKTLSLSLILIALVLTGKSAEAAPHSKAPKASVRKSTKVGTNHSFDGQMVGGQGQAPMEALSEVENEKSIDSLIGVRKNFADRSQKAKGLR